MDEFSKLLALTHAAESCNGATQQFVEYYSDIPEWSHFLSGALAQPAADSQAKEHMGHIRAAAARLQDYIRDWDKAHDGLGFVIEAIASIPTWPIFKVNGRTYSTAHEAARAAAEWMVEIYRQSAGWNDREIVADIAARLAQASPLQDLCGYIEREHFAASPIAPLAPELTPMDARNKFCFDEWQAGKTLKEINVALKRYPQWESFDDEKSVRGPINSWAQRIGETPRKGQPGRRPKSAQ